MHEFKVEKRNDEKKADENKIFISLTQLVNHSIYAGDLVIVKNTSNSVLHGICGIAWPSFTCEDSDVQLSNLARINLNVKLGDFVTVNKISHQIPHAKTVVVDLVSPTLKTFNDSLFNHISLYLENVAYVCKHNMFDISFGGDEKRFKIIEILPEIAELAPNEIIAKKDNTSTDINSDYNKIEKDESNSDKDTLLLFRVLNNTNIISSVSITPPRGVLLYGPPGTGKTMIARAVANETKANVIIINGSEITTKYFGESEAKLNQLFLEARNNAPSIIFIDEIDALCPKRSSNNTTSTESRIVTTLLTLMDGFSSNANKDNKFDRVVVIGATNRPNSIDEALRRPGRFDREVEIPVPTTSDRFEILSVILKQVPNDLTNEQISSISDKLHGFVGADIMSLCREAGLLAIKRCFKHEFTKFSFSDYQLRKLNDAAGSSKEDSRGSESPSEPKSNTDVYLTIEDLQAASKMIKPSSMREIMLEVPKVYWSDIGGQSEIKAILQEAIQLPLENPGLFTNMGISPPKGVLLYGPPGCSKTLFAKALATESGLNFIAIKGPELFNKYVGESEKAVRNVFKRARANSPSIVFFDEIDSLTTNRSGSGGSGESGSVSERVLAQLLMELDGIDSLSRVTVVAATNRPDIIDSALLRPGRFDRIVYVPPPDFESRVSIFSIQLKKMRVNEVTVTPTILAEMVHV
ncbi:Spermatogenesis-associated protein 5 [Smittium culicis]|uniref:Spermatogenesis-associated protein 5 n=1 Tax=Smittium culicis TaxID=133412 RepID=A0A1R1XY00_9FUNG|nr:Spermatogenesis-associated protein 5 [Smittium culicis]